MRHRAGGSSLSEVRTNAKGYRLATTVQGPATGKGAHFIIVDDPFKAAEAASESIRNAVYDWFKGSLMTRFDKPAEGAMVVVQQRLHQDDLIGRLRDEGGWEYLAMPGECVERRSSTSATAKAGSSTPATCCSRTVQPAALEQLFWDLGEGPVQRANPAAAFAAGRRALQAQAFSALRDAAPVLRGDRAELGSGDRRHRDRGFLGLHDLGHHRPQALFDRRAAQAARFPQHRARDPAYEGEVQRQLVVLETAGVGMAIGNAL